MGLLLVCPDCETKGPLTSRTCQACGADLRDLPASRRRYVISTPAPVSAPVPEVIPERGALTGIEAIPEAVAGEAELFNNREVSLCEALDRILNKGAVVFGEVMISVANIDLIYLSLQVILSSMETARGLKCARGQGHYLPNLGSREACL